jgi:hypothetical protein
MLRRHGHAGQAELAGLTEQVLRELAALVDHGRSRPHDLLGEVPDGLLQQALLLRELQVHGRRSISGEISDRNARSESAYRVHEYRSAASARPRA